MREGVAVWSVLDSCIKFSHRFEFTTHHFSQIKTSMEKDKVVNEEMHRIRITLTSTNVKAVEKGMFVYEEN